MNKVTIGLLFILAGLLYGCLASDRVYNLTLGYLVEHKWMTPPVAEKVAPDVLGRRSRILLFSLALIFIGLYLIWNHQL